jgi:hypothetical protein
MEKRFMRRRLGASIPTVVVAAFALFLASCGSDKSTDVQVVVPKITSLGDSTLAVGDTLDIVGSKFAATVTGNTVVFNNTLASVSPATASATLLRVVVPADANTGPLYVVSSGQKSNSVAVEIERGVGDVWVVGGGSVLDLKVPVSTGSEEYLVVAESATSSGARFTFQVIPETTTVYPAPPLSAPRGGTGTTDAATAFEGRVRGEALEFLKTHGAGKKGVMQKTPSSAPQQTAEFYVLKCASCSVLSASSFARVTATLQYDGTRGLIYADDTQPTGSFTPGDYAAFGAQFDNEIYPTDTNAFGAPTDIDENGKVIILFTPVVNDLTPDGTAVSGFISGFFLINDLAPGIFPAGTSNGAEIFYAMVPDPNAEYGNAFSKSIVESVVPGTLAHEFEHMISMGYRYVTLTNGTDPRYIQQTWLEEGMAHIAEDLNHMDTQNILRGNLFLGEPYATSLLGNAELRPYNVDTLEQRGGIFLFLRYLGDQLGNQIFRTMVRGPEVGTATVEKVTKMNFYASVADYLAALYLSDRGITSDPTYEYTSFNIQTDFGPLLVGSHAVSDGAFSGEVRSATGSFYRITGGEAPAVRVRVSSSNSSKIQAILVRIQ